MKTKQITISIPETMDEDDVKRFLLVKIQEHLFSLKEEEIKVIEDNIDLNMDIIKKENEIQDSIDVEPIEIQPSPAEIIK